MLVARSGRLAAALAGSPPKEARRARPASAAACSTRQAGSEAGGSGSGSDTYTAHSRAAGELRPASRAAARMEQLLGPRRDFSRGLNLPPTAPEEAPRPEIAPRPDPAPRAAEPASSAPDGAASVVTPAWVPGMPYTKRHVQKPKRHSQRISHSPSQPRSQPAPEAGPSLHSPLPHSPPLHSPPRRSPHSRGSREPVIPVPGWAEHAPQPALSDALEPAGAVSGPGAAAAGRASLVAGGASDRRGDPSPPRQLDSPPPRAGERARARGDSPPPGERARLLGRVAELERRAQAAEGERRAAEERRREAEEAGRRAESRARRAEAALREAEQRAVEAEAEAGRLRGGDVALRSAAARGVAVWGAAEAAHHAALHTAVALHTCVDLAAPAPAATGTDAAAVLLGIQRHSRGSRPASGHRSTSAVVSPDAPAAGGGACAAVAGSPREQHSRGTTPIDGALHSSGSRPSSKAPLDYAPQRCGGGHGSKSLLAGLDERRAQGLLSKSSLQALSEFATSCGDDETRGEAAASATPLAEATGTDATSREAMATAAIATAAEGTVTEASEGTEALAQTSVDEGPPRLVQPSPDQGPLDHGMWPSSLTSRHGADTSPPVGAVDRHPLPTGAIGRLPSAGDIHRHHLPAADPSLADYPAGRELLLAAAELSAAR